jgi:hypothetical protein
MQPGRRNQAAAHAIKGNDGLLQTLIGTELSFDHAAAQIALPPTSCKKQGEGMSSLRQQISGLKKSAGTSLVVRQT